MKRLLICIACLFALTFVGSRSAIAWGIMLASGGGGADVTAPTLSTFEIGTDGDTWTFTYDEIVTATDDGDMCDGYTITMSTAGAITFTYASGTRGSASVFTCTGSATVDSGETIGANGLDYTQGTITDVATNALAALDDKTTGFTNNSTQGGGALEFAETFDFTGQITADASWTATSNGLTSNFLGDSTYAYMLGGNDYNYYHGVYITASGGITQAVKMKMGEASINTSLYNGYGALLRCEAANATGDCYRLYVKGNNTGVVRFATDYMTDFTSTDYGSDVTIDAVTDGDWIGFAVTGTGASTVFSYWDFGASDPGAYSTWGDPTQTLDNTGLDSYVDTGDYMGFFLSWHTSAPHNTVNDWAGGGW